ncbi:hypothetical protein B0A55_12293 [Friedmanniomyces simplex]|uniref:BTB domain-containing protein n=1 Tax=Friedmanniomyces simplex TaxID=329884 RepID=A0A4U0VQC4_9PEZI|nr:hypothetical protein B0A55_12293 [Friedmanniomyces simplex]
MVGTDAVVKRSRLRNLLMRAFHLGIWLLTTERTAQIKDTQCGFKLFTRPALPYIIPYMHSEGWIFDVEMLMLAESADIPMVEVPVGWKEVMGSKLNVVKDSIGMAVGLGLLRVCGFYQLVYTKESNTNALANFGGHAGPGRTAIIDILCAVWKLKDEGFKGVMGKSAVAKMDFGEFHVHGEGVNEMSDKIITVEVGQAKQTFALHRSIASFYSDYFEAAVKDTFKEGKEGVIKLPTEDVETFELLLWLLADRRDVPILANMTINGLREEVIRTSTAPIHHLNSIYDNTTESTGLRRFCVYLISHMSGVSVLKESLRCEYPAEALWDILRVVWTLDNRKNPPVTIGALATSRLCAYHTHEEGVECPQM